MRKSRRRPLTDGPTRIQKISDHKPNSKLDHQQTHPKACSLSTKVFRFNCLVASTAGPSNKTNNPTTFERRIKRQNKGKGNQKAADKKKMGLFL
jgi:hypothetical protein